MKNNKGFSLVELMVSLTISVVFVASAASLMSRNKTDYVPLRDGARMNEGAMAVFDVVNRELEQAGFFGENQAFQSIDFTGSGAAQSRFVSHIYDAYRTNVVRYDSLFGFKRDFSASGFSSTAIEGVDGDNIAAGFFPSGVAVFHDGTPLANDMLPGTDAITIRGSHGGRVNIAADDLAGGGVGDRGPGVRLAQDAPAGAGVLQLENAGELSDTGYFVVFDALNSELFKATRLGNTLTLTPDSLGTNMPSTAFVNSFSSLIDGSVAAENGQAYVTEVFFSRYYVGNYNAPDGTVIPSLFREFYDPVLNDVRRNAATPGGNDAQVMIEGVENMQITYAEDTNGDGGVDVYAPANDVANWSNVKAVKISLLVRSETQSSVDATTGTRVYQVNDEEITPGTTDRFSRKVFSTTVALDNGI